VEPNRGPRAAALVARGHPGDGPWRLSLHLLLLACSCAIDLLRQAQETDTVLLFIAGHGFNDGPNDCFLPNCRQCSGLSAQR
jgi:hypothetical protein